MKLFWLTPLIAVVAMAQSNSEVLYWPADHLHGYESTLGEALVGRTSKSASEWLSDLGNYKFEILRRDGSGAPEQHNNWTDIFIVQDGEATILYGGAIADGRDQGDGEVRGPNYTHAKSQAVGAGDVFVVPPGVAHQTIVADGKSFFTLIVKVQKK